jgi:hypothetical protein
MTITEGSHIKLTVARAILVAGVLISLAGSGAVAWYSNHAQLESHVSNNYVHLDPRFAYEHGLPVGKWDLAGRDDAATASFKALQDQADYLKRRVDVLEAEVSNRKPRWHP